MINKTNRVRFAPSPTGYLHVGGLRTALYNYLFAKKTGGKFILRIEDTDRNRYVEGAVENLLESIKWSGINYDEGPDNPGEFGPYMQSERLEIYKKYADQLIADKKAYHCFCTPERLAKLREEQQAAKLPQAKYDKKCLHLSQEEVQTKIDAGETYVIRLNVEPGPKVSFDDKVRGHVQFDRETIDDQVLIKTDGFPTYHMANVVDDHLMKITHVIRGEEWLSSTPKHVLLYENLGWELPVFAHLPLLLNSDKSKLSKRQGDVAVEDYRDKGYFKEALINFVALLGWSAGDNKEFYNLQELEEAFSLDKVHKAGAVFNIDKLNWMNTEHLKSKSDDELLTEFKKYLTGSQFDENLYNDDELIKIIASMKERVTFTKDFVEDCSFYYTAPTEYDEKTVQKRWKERSPEVLKIIAEKIENLEEPTKENYNDMLHGLAEELELGMGQINLPLRLAVSGVGGGPNLAEMLEILGKEEIIKRINDGIKNIKK